MAWWAGSGSPTAAWPAPRIWRGCAQTGRRYIIGAPKSELKKFGSELASAEAGARSRKASRSSSPAIPRPDETVILCRSADRRSKEKAMHDKFSARIEAALRTLGRAHRPLKETARSGAGEPADRPHPAAEPARRRPLRHHAGAGSIARQASVSALPTTPRSTTGPRSRKAPISCARTSTDWSDRAALEGLHPTHPGRSRFPHPERSAERPADLASARGSRSGSHPRLLSRLRAVEVPRDVAERAGLGNSPRTILEELARIQSHDVVLPTATHGQIRLRCVTQPDPAQAALLDRLGIVLPKRMRLAEHEAPRLARTA